MTSATKAITLTWMSLQIYVDLVIAVIVICAVIVGMFSPLVYLLTRNDVEHT